MVILYHPPLLPVLSEEMHQSKSETLKGAKNYQAVPTGLGSFVLLVLP